MYDRAIGADPNNTIAWINKGTIQIRVGNYIGAIDTFDHALQVNPDDTDAHLYKGIAMVKMDNFRDAIKEFDAVIAL